MEPKQSQMEPNGAETEPNGAETDRNRALSGGMAGGFVGVAGGGGCKGKRKSLGKGSERKVFLRKCFLEGF